MNEAIDEGGRVPVATRFPVAQAVREKGKNMIWNRCGFGLGAWAVLLAFGCDTASKSPPPPAPLVKASELTLVVVDDPGLGDTLARRWSSEGNGTLKVQELTSNELIDGKFQLKPDVDVILFPNTYFGDFLAAEQLLEIDDTNLKEQINRDNLLSHYRAAPVRYGESLLALPVSFPHWACFYRKDVSGTEIPATWSDLTAVLQPQEGLPTPWLEPLAGVWAAHSLLARTAPAIRFRGKISTVFDLDTMKPLIATPPFVRALTEMVEQHRILKTSVYLTPAEVFQQFRQGAALRAMTWPTSTLTASATFQDLGVARLPGTREWFDPAQDKWIPREGNERSVDYLGSTGRLIGVARDTLHANEALAMAAWCASALASQKMMPESQASGPFRLSHLGNLRLWTKESLPDDAVDLYAEVIRGAHESELSLFFPRISRQADYLESLGKAVHAALEGKLEPSAALEQTSREWEALTNEIGRDRQRDLLRKTEGLLTGRIVE